MTKAAWRRLRIARKRRRHWLRQDVREWVRNDSYDTRFVSWARFKNGSTVYFRDGVGRIEGVRLIPAGRGLGVYYEDGFSVVF